MALSAHFYRINGVEPPKEAIKPAATTTNFASPSKPVAPEVHAPSSAVAAPRIPSVADRAEERARSQDALRVYNGTANLDVRGLQSEPGIDLPSGALMQTEGGGSGSADEPETRQPPGGDDDHINDVVGDQSGIREFDFSASDSAEERARTGQSVDAIYGYQGRDGEGAWVLGGGFLDVEQPGRGVSGVEVLTFDYRYGSDPDGFSGIALEANALEMDFWADRIHVGLGTAGGNLRADQSVLGGNYYANAIEVGLQNGQPSADNPNDINVNGGLSLGIPSGGFNYITHDPDGDGITNVGFDLNVPVGPFGVNVGGSVEDPAGIARREFWETAHAVESAVNGRLPGMPSLGLDIDLPSFPRFGF